MATVHWKQVDDPFWRPWQDFFRFSGAAEDPWPRSWSRNNNPSLNVWNNPEEAIVTVQLPGVDPSELDLSLEGKTLTLRGERKATDVGENASVHRRERAHGRFLRTVELPFQVENDAVVANYERGVLEVKLPKAESKKHRKITVASA